MVYELSYTAVSTVNASWEEVRQIADYQQKAGVGLFRRLFEMSPTASSLFHFDQDEVTDEQFYQTGRLVKHAVIFVDMIDRAVQLLGPDVDLLTDVLKDLGETHAQMGVRPSYYPLMGKALVSTLEELLGDDFGEEAKQGWTEVWQAMSYDMIRAEENTTDQKLHPGRRQSGDEWNLLTDALVEESEVLVEEPDVKLHPGRRQSGDADWNLYTEDTSNPNAETN